MKLYKNCFGFTTPASTHRGNVTNSFYLNLIEQIDIKDVEDSKKSVC